MFISFPAAVQIAIHFVSQRVGDHRPIRRRAVRPANLPSAAGPEAGSLPAGPEETTGGADEDHG